MLHEFLAANRTELIDRCRAKVATRRAPRATPMELEHGIPLFLDQLTAMLPAEGTRPAHDARAKDRDSQESRMRQGATRHGNELLRHGFSIDQVVHDYGDLCQAITELAAERRVPIAVEDFGILNIRLDNAIGGAVTEYARQREISTAEERAMAINEKLGVLARDMRNLLNTSIVAISAIKGGWVGFGGATAAALDRSLVGMRELLDRTLAEVRLEGDAAPSVEDIDVAQFIAEVRVAAALEASTIGCELTVRPVAAGLVVQADRHILAAAVSNLLQNAFGCTASGGHVVLGAHAARGSVLIEVEELVDESGAPVPGMAPLEPRGGDRRGHGAGIALSRQGVEANGGRLYARDVPGRGAVFTIELPQKVAGAAE